MRVEESLLLPDIVITVITNVMTISQRASSSVDTLSLWVEVLSVLLERLPSWAGSLQRETLTAGRNMAPGSDFTVGKSHSKVIVIRAGVNQGHLFWDDLSDIYLYG